MNYKSAIVFVLILAAAALAHGDQAQTVAANIGPDCKAKPASFTVPDGKSAVNFALVKLEPGSSCDGEPTGPENKGFTIRDNKNRPLYTWSQYQSQAPYEKGGPLKNLNLVPGAYLVTVAGGAGARVEISYQLK